MERMVCPHLSPQFPQIIRAVSIVIDISPADDGLLVPVELPIKARA